VLVERLLASLASLSRDADTAEWRLRGAHAVGVDPDGARDEPVGDAVRAREVPRPDPRGETERRGVREADGLRLVREPDDREHWPEDLLLRELGLVVDVGEHRGRDEESALEPLAGDRPAAC